MSGAVLLSLPRSSFVCGLAGALASNPVDVVRTRLMNQRGGALYQGTVDCILQVRNTHLCVWGGFSGLPHSTTNLVFNPFAFLQTWRHEGFMALYKGFFPNWLRLGPWNIIVSFKCLIGAPVCLCTLCLVLQSVLTSPCSLLEALLRCLCLGVVFEHP